MNEALISSGKTQFDHKNDLQNSNIEKCNILGVNIAEINMEWLIEYLNKMVKHKDGNLLSGDYICVCNVYSTVTAYKDESYKAILNGGDLAIPDGGPLSVIGRRRGWKNMRRTTGPGLMGEMFLASSNIGYRHFFYGSTEDTLNKLIMELKRSYPYIQIAGTYSPPFRTLTEEEDENVIKLINNVKPDFIWVGLGAPKQERWMAAHKDKVQGLMIGVGAGFDYYAKNIKRAPNWMQSCNLEWLYRLFQEPKRLFMRYMKTNWMFLWLTIVRGK